MTVPNQLGKWGQALGASEGVISLKDLTLIQQSAVEQDTDQDGVADSIAISSDGRTIVGRGRNPAGLVEAFIATLDG